MIDSKDKDRTPKAGGTATPPRHNGPDAALADVVITEQLTRRTSRPQDYRAENEALHNLTRQMAEYPENLLDNLVTTALSLCRASAAGVSVLETDSSGEAIFRWAALAGAYKHYIDYTIPEDSSPCGLCLERGAPQLYALPGRYFSSAIDTDPQVREALMLPFPEGSGRRGTLWITTHDEARAFDSEDVRVLTALAGFTAAALRHADAVKSQQAQQPRETRLAAEHEALNDLHQLTNRLLAAPNLQSALDELLDATLALHGTDMGTVLIREPSEQGLMPLAHRGFEDASEPVPTLVRRDAGSSCALALRSGQRVVVEDYETDTRAAPHRALAAALGYRASQSTPLLTREGKLLGMLSTQFQQSHHPSGHVLRMTDLYARQGALAIERHQSQVALREADRRKNEFLAMLAHELRDPLAPIRNTLHVLRREDVDRGAMQSMSQMLERQVGQMARLVDDLLDVSRITRGQIELRRERVALADIVSQAEEAAHPQCQGKGIEFTVTLPDQPLYVYADPVRLAQILGSLLSNACKFTDSNGLIALIAEQAHDEAVIRVRDTGIGIAADSFDRIFEMFGQVDAVRQRRHGGLGIGLTLARELTELHKGSVAVQSAGPGQGSEFVVRLPLAREPEPAPPAPPNEEPEQASHRILVVDDNPDSTDSLSLLLGLIGHEVRTAQDGVEGLEAAAAFRPELILLDIGLPKLDGLEVCRRLRGGPWGQTMVIAALTGWGGQDDRDRSAAAGFDRHLVKPVDDETLMQLLASLPNTASAG